MTQDTSGLEREVQVAVEADSAGIAERVRTITLDALSRGTLDAQGLREVMGAVIRGAQQARVDVDARHTEALKDAMRGLDDALATAAQATQLAVQEAIGRSSEFSREDLKHSLDQLSTLEGDFIAALGDAARATSGQAQATLRDLAEHARSSGTAVGGRVRDALGQLGQAAGELARAQFDGGVRTMRNQAELFASLAAGVLRGLADRLQPGASEQREPDRCD